MSRRSGCPKMMRKLRLDSAAIEHAVRKSTMPAHLIMRRLGLRRFGGAPVDAAESATVHHAGVAASECFECDLHTVHPLILVVSKVAMCTTPKLIRLPTSPRAWASAPVRSSIQLHPLELVSDQGEEFTETGTQVEQPASY